MAFLKRSLVVLFALISCSLVGITFSENPLSSYEVIFGWRQLDFQFSTAQTRERLIQTKEFIPENNVLVGVKIWKDRIFLTVPRWRNGIPSTMNYLNLNEAKRDGGEVEGPAPLLKPYPSWALQQIGNCNAFQFTMSMEIDEFGRMWVIDTGRVNIFGQKEDQGNHCPAKLVIIDLEKDQVIKTYEFPSDVVSPTSNFLNDIVVACESPKFSHNSRVSGSKDKDNCWAYITDAMDAKLIIYNLKEDRSWFVHHKSMAVDHDATEVEILGGNYTFKAAIDGIALSPKDSGYDRVYYTPLASYGLHSVPTSILQVSVNGVTLKDQDVTTHNSKRFSQSDGMVMDSQGLLFYGVPRNNSVAFVNSTDPSGFTKEILLISNEVDLQWPDAFGIDEKGYLYVVTNRMHRFQTNTLDWGEVNFRVSRVFTGDRSYIYGAEDEVSSGDSVKEQDLQNIDSSSSSSNLSPTNLDKDAPDEPTGIGRKDSDIYKHDGEHLGWNEMGDVSDDHHHHSSHQQGSHSHATGEEADAPKPTSSAPLANEQLPVVLFLSVLMYNPALLLDHQ